MSKAIEINNMSFSYEGSSKVLDNINLSIEEGSVIVLTGPSGSGKSTLTKIINGLIPHFYEGILSGQMYLFGKNANDIEDWQRGRYIGSVFQDPRSQFFSNEVAGEIAFARENYGLSHEEIVSRTHKSAKMLQLEDTLKDKMRFLSYGMRQKVAIASAHAIEPVIYVMDEPSANLDIESTLNLADEIKRLKKLGKTILIAEHRLFYLKDVADSIIYLKDGKIEQIFTPKQMLELEHKKVKSLGLRSIDIGSIRVDKNMAAYSGNEIMLEVKALNKKFAHNCVAKDIEFTFKQGEIIALVGRNAVGKSSLGKILSDLIKQDSGKILYKNKKIGIKNRRALVWYIMQDLDSQLFGEDLVDELLKGKKKTNTLIEKAEAILRDLDLYHLKDQHPGTFSGGQKQRLILGVALMYEFPIIILDEPTSGLDGKNMRKVGSQIKKIAQKGHTILMITHDMECVLSICSRILHMQDGKITNDFYLENTNQLLKIIKA